MAPSSKGAVAGGDGGALPALGLPGMASSSARTAAGHGKSPWSTSQLTVPPQILFAGGLMLKRQDRVGPGPNTCAGRGTLAGNSC